MRWKNRQVTFTLDIPKDYEEDDEFLNALAEVLDDNGWKMKVEDGEVEVCISKIRCGDVEAYPEG